MNHCELQWMQTKPSEQTNKWEIIIIWLNAYLARHDRKNHNQIHNCDITSHFNVIITKKNRIKNYLSIETNIFFLVNSDNKSHYLEAGIVFIPHTHRHKQFFLLLLLLSYCLYWCAMTKFNEHLSHHFPLSFITSPCITHSLQLY